MIRVTRLDRYIGAQVLGAFMVVLLVLVGLMGLSLLLEELGDTNQHYTTSDALFNVLLSLPGYIYQLLPLSALVGTLIGLGVLASNSELTVMRASGQSLLALLVSIGKPVALIALVAILMGEFGVPYAQQAAKNQKAIAESAAGKRNTDAGAWFREGDLFVHITAIDPGGDLIGIVQHRIDSDKRLIETLRAERATALPDQSGWVLQNSELMRVRPDGEGSGLAFSHQSEARWSSSLDTRLLSVILVEPSDLPISGLLTYAAYLDEQGVNAQPYLLAFWNKVFQPVSIFALVMVGVAFIFGPLRSVTVGQRIITGVIVGLIFKFSQDLLAPASQVLGFSPLLAAALPPFISLMIGVLLIRRAQ